MKVQVISAGRFKLDGGAMFGVVPRRMWEHMNPPDAQNMCSWSMQPLLVETGNRVILFDTGIGNKQDQKFRSHFEPSGDDMFFQALEKAGCPRERITDVFLTHLHFDHCGGAIWHNAATGRNELAFPNAVYWSVQRHWDWAVHPNEREKASFLKENFMPLLEEKGRLRMVDCRQDTLWLPGIRIRFLYGHTEAMMMPVIEINGRTLVYCADLMPSQWHIGMPYVMAYDVRPLKTLEEKKRLLQRAVQQQHILLLEHDPVAEAVTVHLDSKGRIVPRLVGSLAELLEIPETKA